MTETALNLEDTMTIEQHENDCEAAADRAWKALVAAVGYERAKIVDACQHLNFADNLSGARCLDCGAETEAV